MCAKIEMPKYKCHKEVHALKINKVRMDVAGVWTITPSKAGYATFVVPEDYVARHNPKDGGYYVVYEDGYRSYSPAKAFEAGYAKI